MWSYIIDGILILTIVICIIVGIAKGLVDSILSLIGTGIALVASVFLSKYVANFVNKIFNFEEFVLKHLDASNDGTIKIFGTIELSNVEVAKFAVWIASVVIMFTLIKLAIFIISKMFEKVIKSNPTASGINRLLGMIFGAVKGGVIVLVGLALCSLVAQLPIIGAPVYDAVQSTHLTKYVYNIVEDFVEDNLTQEKIEGLIEKIVSENDEKDEDENETEEGNTEQLKSSNYIKAL